MLSVCTYRLGDVMGLFELSIIYTMKLVTRCTCLIR